MSFDLADWSNADFFTGLIGGLLSIALVAFGGRYASDSFTKTENRNLVGFCLGIGLFIGQGAVVNGSPKPDDVELFGRAVGSLSMLIGIWYLWFKRTDQPEIENG